MATTSTMSPFVLVSAPVPGWQPGHDPVLYLGDWSVPAGIKVRAGFDVVMPYPWMDDVRVAQDYQYCHRLYDELLPQLASRLNSIHEMQQGVDYWRAVAGPWFYHFIQTFFERRANIEVALQSYPITRAVGVAEGALPPVDSLSVSHKVFDDDFNVQLYSWILRHWGVEVIPVAQSLQKTSSQHETTLAARGRGFLRKLLFGLTQRFLRHAKIIHVATIFSPKEMLALWWKSSFRISPFFVNPVSPAISQNAIDSHARQTLAQMPSQDSFARALVQALPDWIPQSFIEQFPALRQYVLTNWPQNPKLILTSYLFSGTDTGKIWLAECRARSSARLIAVQHSGIYGFFRREFSTYHEDALVDESWSWGWTTPAFPKMKAMPSPVVNRVRGRSEAFASDRILVLPAEARKYTANFVRSPFSAQVDRHVTSLNELLHALLSRLHTALRLRARPWIANNGKAFDALNPPIQSDEYLTEPLTFSMSRSRLTLITYNGTSFLEALGTDLPTILIWDLQLNPVRPEAEAVLSLLTDARILFTQPRLAGEHINAIYDDVGQWWNAAATERARKEFLQRMAVTDAHWMEQWVQKVDGQLPVTACPDQVVMPL